MEDKYEDIDFNDYNAKIILKKDKSGEVKSIDMDIYGNHFDGVGITKYQIINDAGEQKLIVEFSVGEIEQIIKKED